MSEKRKNPSNRATMMLKEKNAIMKKWTWFVLTCLLALVLVLGACGPGAEEAAEEEKAVTGGEPQYGGTLNSSFLIAYDPTSWDPADCVWNTGFFTGFYLEDLLVGDFEKYGPRGTNEFAWTGYEWAPLEFLRGELAESWEFTDETTLIFHLRHGIYWQSNPNVMASRELTADDVVFSLMIYKNNPKYGADRTDFIKSWTALDKYTVELKMNYFNAEWPYVCAWGQLVCVYPPELVDAGIKDWKNHVGIGTGPFLLTDYISGSSVTYEKNPNYWDKTVIDGKTYEIPFVDKVSLPKIQDQSTQVAAFRTGKLDMMGIPWKYRESVEETNPDLIKWRYLTTSPRLTAFRMDTPPFDDIRVRLALCMAVDQQAIADTEYGSEAVLFSYPFAADWPENYYTPIEKAPQIIKDQFTYNPEKAKELLAEAGYPEGFQMELIYATVQDPDDTLSMIVDWWADIGVQCELKPYEYATFMSMFFSRQYLHAAHTGHGNCSPVVVLRTRGMPDSMWNPALFNDPVFNEKFTEARGTFDDVERAKMLKELNVYFVSQVPWLIYPAAYGYTYQWPWIKNYYGEINVATWKPCPTYARVWIDQEMKKEMGY
jgi:peptide/nickel transport system substrate-binding protein